MNNFQHLATLRLSTVLLLAGLFVAVGGCDVISQEQENRVVAGTYGPAPTDSLSGFTAIFTPFSFRARPIQVDLTQHPEASFSMTLDNSVSTQPGDNKENDGRVEGHIAVPGSLYASPDSVQLLFSEGIDRTFSGEYMTTIDRLYLQLEADTTEEGGGGLIPRQWTVEENGMLRASISRVVDRDGESVDEPQEARGEVELLFRLREE